MHEPGRQESRNALDRVEESLKSARSKVDEGNREDAREDADNAYAACDEIGKDLGDSIKPLVDNVRKDLAQGSTSTDQTVRIDIDNAQAQVDNVRPSL